MRNLFILPLFIFLFIPKKLCFASEPNFSITTDINYKIFEDGNTKVTQIFNATNLTQNTVLSEFSLKPGIAEIKKVGVYDQNGAVSYQVLNGDISMTFSNPSRGINNTYSWTIYYETKDIAKKNGRLWEIFISKPAIFPNLNDFSISLSVPSIFGKNVLIKPVPLENGYFWTKANLKAEGVNLVFDPTNTDKSYETYDFKQNFALVNPKIYPVTFEIILPPDTSSQKVFLTDISPKPINIRLDNNGNWLAKYQVGPQGHLDVATLGYIAVYLNTLPETNISSSVQKIYNQVVTSNKIKNTSFELANTFVTQAVSQGILARTIEGYLNPEGPHIWAEYFNNEKKIWVALDPAMGKATGLDYFTLFDFNHIVLAIQKDSSSTLTPATKFEIKKTIKNIDFNLTPKIGIRADIPKLITSGFKAQATIYVENYGPTTYVGEPISLSSKHITFVLPKISPGILLPFATSVVKFDIEALPWNYSKNDIITLEFENEKRTYPVVIKPFYNNGLILIISFLFILGIISIFTQIARGLFLSRQIRKNNLRGKSK